MGFPPAGIEGLELKKCSFSTLFFLKDLKERCSNCLLDLLLMVLTSVQVVQSGGKNIELAVMRRDQPLKVKAALAFLPLQPVSLIALLYISPNFHSSSHILHWQIFV